MSQIANKFVKATKLRSIHRQLNIWGFRRLQNVIDKDAWFNENFVRGQPKEMAGMVRTKVKSKLSPAKLDLDVPEVYSLSPTESKAYGSIAETFKRTNDIDRKESHTVSPPTPKPAASLVSLTFPPFPGYDTTTSPTPLPRRNRYCHRQVSNITAEHTHDMIEPLPIGIDIDNEKPLDNVDEFFLFICRMIQDPSE